MSRHRKPAPESGRYLTADEVARVLRITSAEALAMVARGELAARVVVRGEVLIAEASLREFVDGAWLQRNDRLDGGERR